MSDNVVDGIEFRRDQPSWHTRDNVGLTALNDAILLETCVYTLLKMHFGDKPYYKDLVEEFHVVSSTLVGFSFKKTILLLTGPPLTEGGSPYCDGQIVGATDQQSEQRGASGRQPVHHEAIQRDPQVQDVLRHILPPGRRGHEDGEQLVM